MAQVILVADDDPDDVFLLSRACLTAGLPHRVLHVRDGQEAISYLSGELNYVDRFRFPLPALLVLDLNLPRRNGFGPRLTVAGSLPRKPPHSQAARFGSACNRKCRKRGASCFRDSEDCRLLSSRLLRIRIISAWVITPRPVPVRSAACGGLSRR